ncbi:MAG: hypothetical protein HN712_14690 [Gemmatimonadetes bacterium]|jgi:hypothetical protein|nr:hypothetical protein [Gemmatimonadota bacterium]MBT7861565.1 hypothetical protein [Gemmatimonadota bacterium]
MKRILVDDREIARRHGVIRQAHAAEKMDQPVLIGEAPWECDGPDRRLYLYGTVLGDPSVGYRMWYASFPDQVCYAVSDDGLHWERPDLGLVEFEGSRANNILPIRLHSPSFILDADEADPSQRYKMLGCGRPAREGEGETGYCVAHSGDGLEWTLYPRNPVLPHSDTCTLAQDRQTGEYLAFHKWTHEYRGHTRRLVYLAVSPDMQTWSDPVLVMAPDEVDDELVRGEGGISSEFYNMSAFEYAGQWLGLVTHFRYSGAPDVEGPAQSPHDGPIDVQLVHSRDGREWSRCEDRSAVIANGPFGHDAGSILGVTNQPVIAGDRMWIYYTAITTTHGGCLPEKQITIARASWRLDGWVSLNAGQAGGSVETTPFESTGETLLVNVDAAGGLLTAEVLSEDGACVQVGYEAGACDAIQQDGTQLQISWRHRKTLPASGTIRLRFQFANAKLFSWSTSPLGSEEG